MAVEQSGAKDERTWHDDWPEKTGPIDLRVHDLPHKSSDVEWWYVNSHLKSEGGKELSLFTGFFRSVIGFDAPTEELIYAHAATWAITDAEANKHYYYSMLDPVLKPYILENIDKETALDKHLCQSLKEVFERNVLPLPDMEIEGDIVVSQDKLFLDYGGSTFRKDENGCYHLSLKGQRPGEEAESGCDLMIRPLKPAVRNRSDGVVKVGLFGDDMFYYFITRNECSGTVSIAGEEFKVTGTAWYDHEFGGVIRASSPREKGAIMSDNFAWEWLSVQFEEEDLDLTACVIEVPNKDFHRIDSYSITIAANGTRVEKDSPIFEAVPGKVWRSSQTFVEYPTAWIFKQGDIELKLSVGNNPSQEFQTLISFPAFWEGRVQCVGTIAGKPVHGLGFIERHGYGRSVAKSLKNLFEASSLETRKRIREIMPLKTDSEGEEIGDDGLRRIFGDSGFDAIAEFPKDTGKQAVMENILEPLRDTYDRGGKAWRSQALMVCIDAVGGDSREFSYLLPVPEYLHAGSLIIDDIQDKSTTRRGKDCCHITWGEPLAINAGNFSYFVGPVFYKQLPDDKRLKLLDLFFSTMLSAHVGQGADIAGLEKIMPEVVETGNSELATDMIIGIHRLKSGIPVRHMAQSGCIIGDASEEQVDVIGDFFEQLGVAFQIVDDVVNLTGFSDSNWKTCGEDVMEGKVTFPVALAFKHFEKSTREKVWDILKSKPQDKASVSTIIEHVRHTGALGESRQIAVDRVEKAWKKVVPVLPDSFSKVVMRGSALFILDHLKDSKPLPDNYF